MIKYKNCHILSENGWLINSSFCVGYGRFCEIGTDKNTSKEIDLDGKFVLPGMIDIHGDSFERCITPRPGVNLPLQSAIQENDNHLLSSGITTFFYSITDSFEEGPRSRKSAEEIIKTIRASKLKCNSFIHLRHEIANTKDPEQLIEWLNGGIIDLLSINDHLPRIGDGDNLKRYKNALKRRIVTSDNEIDDLIISLQRQREIGILQVDALVKSARKNNIPLASHDDDTMEKVEISRKRGVGIAEFPMNKECAQAFKDLSIHTLFGAPNLVRGGSHVGALSVQEAAGEDLLQILCSDYHYPSLFISAFKLVSLGLYDLEEAWKKVSLNPAVATGLENEKGSIKDGKDADFLVLDSLDGTLSSIRSVFIFGQEMLKYNNRIK